MFSSRMRILVFDGLVFFQTVWDRMSFLMKLGPDSMFMIVANLLVVYL